jgi:tetratricopeptide (TPR) repeat protein
MFPQNPYVAGNPVGDSAAFVGRADVLQEVLRVLRHAKNNAIVLYGQRRIGKTSVLQELQAQLPKKGAYQPVFFDLQDKAKWPLERVLRDLARTISDALGQAAPDLGTTPETTFHQDWLPELLNTLPTESSLVLLFDEFDVLADPGSEQAGAAFFPYLRDLLAINSKALNFVFVIGRNVDDLTNIALSLFKGTPAKRVSLLSREDTTNLIRLSEASLHWSDDVIETVWQLTCGHPFLTQHLCDKVWENLYDDDPDDPPTVTIKDVETAIPETLDASRNTLEWLWDGLPPAERVVVSALVEAGAGVISDAQLEHLLYESGVRVVIRELQNAPQLLQDWDLIEPADEGYRYRVELLRRWIVEYKPLRRVQDELDRVEPVADNLYKAGLGLYRGGQLEATLPVLRQAISLNPNHVGANQLLADILLAQGQAGNAREILERLYKYQPAAARPRLIQALLALAQSNDNEDEQLKFYEQVLGLDAEQPEAKSGRLGIWQRRGDEAHKAGDLETALAAFRTVHLDDKIAFVSQEIREREFQAQLKLLNEAEQAKRYEEALEQARQLAEDYSDKRDWTDDLERLLRKNKLADLYQRALDALKNDDRETAQTLLVQVVVLEPTYEEATRYLHFAVTGTDVTKMMQQSVEVSQYQQQVASLKNELGAKKKAEDLQPERNWPRYTDNGNGTVTDNKTGLIWLKNANCASRKMTWKKGMQWAAKLAHGQCGLSDGSKAGDWRLPTKEELEAMIDERYKSPALSNAAGTGQWKEGDAFSGVQYWYWSSTENSTSSAWDVSLNDGYVSSNGKSLTDYVWAVRGGH